MAAAGFWQINRHGERGDRNELIEARAALAPVPVGDLVRVGDVAIGEAEQFRRVTATGEYVIDDEVLVRNRTLDGAPGWWVLTPFLLDNGTAVVVNRGWIPRVYDADREREGTEPRMGRQTITGTIQPTRSARGIQQQDPETGRLSSLARPDIERLAEQLSYDALLVVFQLDEASETDVARQALPRGLPLPALDSGPHISYAVQWFVFTTIALVGYPLILRRIASGRSESAPEA